jgi:hypothetical protein
MMLSMGLADVIDAELRDALDRAENALADDETELAVIALAQAQIRALGRLASEIDKLNTAVGRPEYRA